MIWSVVVVPRCGATAACALLCGSEVGRAGGWEGEVGGAGRGRGGWVTVGAAAAT